ncbi:hypothetical protein CHRYSEO8AT_250061 [Chryseobacterium sp. 8AT]|nr:hypothetical protein CHRYSEO8AT_250061 [Chryseobacterium sp. 8AT]
MFKLYLKVELPRMHEIYLSKKTFVYSWQFNKSMKKNQLHLQNLRENKFILVEIFNSL